jgi:hypothetical protein
VNHLPSCVYRGTDDATSCELRSSSMRDRRARAFPSTRTRTSGASPRHCKNWMQSRVCGHGTSFLPRGVPAWRPSPAVEGNLGPPVRNAAGCGRHRSERRRIHDDLRVGATKFSPGVLPSPLHNRTERSTYERPKETSPCRSDQTSPRRGRLGRQTQSSGLRKNACRRLEQKGLVNPILASTDRLTADSLIRFPKTHLLLDGKEP